MQCLVRKRFLGIAYGRYCSREEPLHFYRRPIGDATAHTYTLTYRMMMGEKRFRRLRKMIIVNGVAGFMLGVAGALALRILLGWW